MCPPKLSILGSREWWNLKPAAKTGVPIACVARSQITKSESGNTEVYTSKKRHSERSWHWGWLSVLWGNPDWALLVIYTVRNCDIRMGDGGLLPPGGIQLPSRIPGSRVVGKYNIVFSVRERHLQTNILRVSVQGRNVHSCPEQSKRREKCFHEGGPAPAVLLTVSPREGGFHL